MTLRYTAPYFLWIDGDGVPAAAWKLYFYVTNTTTPLATYNNPDLDPTHANTNPVIANADGYWGPIFLQATDYKVVLKDENDVQIWSADPVSGSNAVDNSSAIQIQAGNYAVDSGAANAYAVTLNPVPASYASLTGAPIRVLIGNSNTTSSTLNINGLGPKAINRTTTVAVQYGDLQQGQIYTFIYDGTRFLAEDLVVMATLGQKLNPTVTVANDTNPHTIATLGAANTGFGVYAVHFDDGSSNTWAGVICAQQFGGTVTAGAITTTGTPGTVAFSMSAMLIQMTRTGGPASVTVISTQLCS